MLVVKYLMLPNVKVKSLFTHRQIKVISEETLHTEKNYLNWAPEHINDIIHFKLKIVYCENNVHIQEEIYVIVQTFSNSVIYIV